ncbi:hypothetical protein [Paremcibacter congregatus]|uniref:hypothetical protein n=1 Tax=Paremcibacter congregatus TaxID=2043170 RepID=UPI003A8DBFB7
MKFSYTHLPEQIQNDLTHIAACLIRRTIPTPATRNRYTPSRIRHIILHGCFTEEHWTPETALHPGESAYSYNLMVIVSAHLGDILAALENAVAELNQSGKISFPVRLRFADTKGRIDQKLRNGYLAYDRIQERGIVLYSRGKITRDLFQLPPRPEAAAHLEQARKYYDHAFPLAQLLLSGARAFATLDRNAAALMLNLAAAEGYAALMAVHILTYPPGHPLQDLRALAESLHPELSMIWTGRRGELIFDHLASAFREVRFSATYQVIPPDLEAMFGHVEDLHTLVRHICQHKFAALKAGRLAKPDKDGLEVVRDALRPSDDAIYGIAEEEAPLPILPREVPSSTPEQAPVDTNLTAALRGLESSCSDLKTIGDILISLTDITAGRTSSCQFALMGQFLQERARQVEDIHEQMTSRLDPVIAAPTAPAA